MLKQAFDHRPTGMQGIKTETSLFLPHDQRLSIIKELPVMNVVSGETYLIKEIFNI